MVGNNHQEYQYSRYQIATSYISYQADDECLGSLIAQHITGPFYDDE